MADLDNPADTKGALIAASTVTGTNVYDHKGEKLGSIYDVMLDKRSGHAEYAILNFGGMFGIGGHYHPLPWNILRYDTSLGGYVVDIDRSRLEGAPSYDGDQARWGSDDLRGRVTDYYGNPAHEDLAGGIGGMPGQILPIV